MKQMFSCSKCGYVGETKEHPGCSYLASPARAWTVNDILHEKIDLVKMDRLSNECGAILEGQHPAMQGSVVADLLFRYVRGYRDAKLRHDMVNWIIAMVRDELEKDEKA